jgi:hypothetical protein
MQYLLYCIVCFRVQGTTKEVFVADDVDATIKGIYAITHS